MKRRIMSDKAHSTSSDTLGNRTPAFGTLKVCFYSVQTSCRLSQSRKRTFGKTEILPEVLRKVTKNTAKNSSLNQHWRLPLTDVIFHTKWNKIQKCMPTVPKPFWLIAPFSIKNLPHCPTKNSYWTIFICFTIFVQWG